MSEPVNVTDHADQAVALLTDHFRTAANVPALLRALCAPVQTLQATLWDVYTKRLYDNAVDAQLDVIGELVGEIREGRNNADYKTAIGLRIKVNKSSGRTIELIEIANLLIVGARYREGDEASFEISAFPLTGSAVHGIMRVLSSAKPAGVRATLAYSTWTPTNVAKRGSTTGAGAGARVYGSTVGTVANAGVRASVEQIS